MNLQEFSKLAYRAYCGTSFSPEKRAADTLESYSAELSADLDTIKSLGGDAEQYEERYKRYFSNWLSAKANCISSMITGPSRFPTSRAEKANNTEQRRQEDFRQFRKTYIAKLERAVRKKAEIKAEAEIREKEIEGGIKIVENYKVDRLQIFFPEKPASKVIAMLKKNGFKWAPSVPCWQRQLTQNAKSAAAYILQ